MSDTESTRDVHAIEHVWIPMADGTRLSARIWLPEDAEREPVPAILEYIPYRKRDATRPRDQGMHPWFAAHGYAAVRVDLRGSGDSEGVLEDEYLQRELDDGVAVIEWLARQRWCSGRVGMMGISWGGFNALQVAALRPEPLKAVVTVCSTDDRYSDDIHHMGGCLLGDNLSWSSIMFAYNSLPPDPQVVGEAWREMWFDRLEGSGLWLDTWLRHQRRDAYWKHGSVAEDYGAVRCPVFAVSGWADGYSNAVFRLLAHLDVPRKGLIGPWGHAYPHLGVPGPAIGFLQECLRWWDRWLKDEDTGVERDPMLRVWMQDSVGPAARVGHRPGRWVAEPAWPSSHVDPTDWRLAPDGLHSPHTPPSEGDDPLPLQSPLPLGLFAGKWCSYAAAPDLPHDQRQEDGGALVFDTEPLIEPLEILGCGEAVVELSSDRPVAMIAARLSDVRPNNEVARVTYGLLNLSHREGSDAPEPLVPGHRYRVRIPLNGVAQSFPAGHRLRLALSTSYWPLAWPPPEPVRLTVHPAGSHLTLPVRPPRPEDEQLRRFGPPVTAEALRREVLEAEHHNWRVIRDLARDASTLHVIDDSGVVYLPEIDLEVGRGGEEFYRSTGNDYGSVEGETRWRRSVARGDWRIRTETRTVLTSDAEAFYLRAELDAYENDTRVYSRNWNERIRRDLL
ncbi:MAG: CocE/NonD family hydrolase [Deinococcus-Thermus bacterium]|jgi:putative CocE/NonD family hydrolase|nr:CocE/NonD family hydrolase [Deinococcota bacterium]